MRKEDLENKIDDLSLEISKLKKKLRDFDTGKKI